MALLESHSEIPNETRSDSFKNFMFSNVTLLLAKISAKSATSAVLSDFVIFRTTS